MSKIDIAQVNQDAAFTSVIQATAGTGALRVVSVAYAATVTPNAGTTDVLNVGSLTGSLALANPSGSPTDWQLLIVNLKASAADRTVTLGSSYLIPTTSVLTSPFVVTSGTETALGFRWNASQSKWRVVSWVSGY